MHIFSLHLPLLLIMHTHTRLGDLGLLDSVSYCVSLQMSLLTASSKVQEICTNC